jgi:protein ImuA
MSPSGRAEGIARLRRAVAEIEAETGPPGAGSGSAGLTRGGVMRGGLARGLADPREGVTRGRLAQGGVADQRGDLADPQAGLSRGGLAQAGLAQGNLPDRRAPQQLSLTRAFDSALGGGLADDALHEIAPAEPADGAAAMGFALALAARFLRRRSAAGLMIGENFAAHEAGALYGPGLVAHGLPLGRLIFVQAHDANAAFWAMEEALKCGAPAAVVGEIWNLKGYSLAASRRLLLAARKGRTPALLVLASAYGQAERLSSAAETRFEIAAARSAPTEAAAGRALPGPFACGARLIKARLTLPSEGLEEPSQAFGLMRLMRLEWRSDDLTFKDMIFDDPAISLPLAAASGDGSRAASRRR